MTLQSGRSKNGSPPGPPLRGRFLGRPTTRLGWWAVWLAAAFVVLYAINAALLMSATIQAPQPLLISYGIVMLLCGLIAGAAALIAIWRRERSWLVWLTLLPFALIIFLLLGEALAPH